MAQLTLHVSHIGRLWGGPSFGLLDFLFDSKVSKAKKYDTSETGANAISAIAGGVKVIQLGQKRRDREKRSRKDK